MKNKKCIVCGLGLHGQKKYCSSVCSWKSMQKHSDGEIKLRWWRDSEKLNKKFLYRYVYVADKKRFVEEHRLIMEKKLGRKLKIGDVVHHINENTIDNRVENLRVFPSHEDHLKAHGRHRLDEDIYFFQDYFDYFSDIFGARKILLLPYDGKRKISNYGKQKINYKRCEHNIIPEEELPFIESIPENKENCLVYSKYFLRRYLIDRAVEILIYCGLKSKERSMCGSL